MFPSLLGSPALSGFRVERLLERIAGEAPGLNIRALDAVFVYFLKAADAGRGAVPPGDLARAQILLAARGEARVREGFVVAPRKGTISPWSSKASDIFRNCGLRGVARVERGIHYRLRAGRDAALSMAEAQPVLHLLHDRMTEGVYTELDDLFDQREPPPCQAVDVLRHGKTALAEANRVMGLALSDEEIAYLYDAYTAMRRNPTDVELVMFGQVNSEHCRHKIFNARWIVDGAPQERSLFEMIRHTHRCAPSGVRVAYSDNSAVIDGCSADGFEVAPGQDRVYRYDRTQLDLLMKVETHNHPTAISPFPGAATGVGGEIRDEAATGTGGKTKAGLSAFMVSNLHVPGFEMPWEETCAEFPQRLATPLAIMTEGPIGGARFGNEFGRPQLCGLFRTLEERHAGRLRGYHKPIMVAGGMGNLKRIHTRKHRLPAGAPILQIGGPAMRIGLGGGAASSMATGSNAEELDFDSVQRDNAEMERRCQEVIDACIALDRQNPILSIHDIGAGGLSNGCPELVSEIGGAFQLRDVPSEDSSLSPMEIWCCEAQERYVLALAPGQLQRFLAICRRERCPAAVIGSATGDERLVLEDAHFANRPIDVDIRVLLGKPPRMVREVARRRDVTSPLDLSAVTLEEAVERVLRLPAVADKTFLISIADRSVTGLVARDQMTGPYQTPVADVAVTATSFTAYSGEAMAMGERVRAALLCAPASGRMAVGEALTNLAAADVGPIGNVKLSANWMCACGEEGEDADLYDTVRAVGMELCPRLGIAIPVGKDSLSMRTLWQDSRGQSLKMTAPVSLIVSAFAPVRDVRRTVTPDLKGGRSALLLVDLGAGRNRLGGSCLAQTFNQLGERSPDVDEPERLASFFEAIQELVSHGLLLAYHDRSDGGLFVTLAEMAFSGRRGMRIDVSALGTEALGALFAEELGAVAQVADADLDRVKAVLDAHGLTPFCHALGRVTDSRRVDIRSAERKLFDAPLLALHRAWSELTFRMQSLRDNPACAAEEYGRLHNEDDPGMQFHVASPPRPAPTLTGAARPRMAILREQGINGHAEMAAAFDRAGFACVDVHMTDLLERRTHLKDFLGLAACGGFSYGDVLGAGSGWARSVLFNEHLKQMFAQFFARPETFALGVCNGCQMLAQLKDIIPGAGAWPAFARNRSEQFEARYVTVEVLPSPSILLRGMQGSRLPVAVAHGEGRMDFASSGSLDELTRGGLAAMRYVDSSGRPTEQYPCNPNGSQGGLTGVCSLDGRVTVMMPHPERGFRAIQLSYRPPGMFEDENGPWLRMFQNALHFVRGS